MKRIEEIDKNFAVKMVEEKENNVTYNILGEPFKVYGLICPQNEGEVFKRIPTDVAKTVNDGVAFLHRNAAGGRVKFKTDSKTIGVTAKYKDVGKMPHFALTGSAGFDLYAGTVHKATFQPLFDISDTLSASAQLDGEMTEYTLNFPLYSTVTEVYITLDKTAKLLPPKQYKYEKPVVFYGSSITQGGCASRTGTSYEAILSRRLDFDYINLGFSGSGKAEDTIAEYIAGLDMSVFVYDYDHNAPTVEHLRETHEKMFNVIRKTHPNIPVICVTKPDAAHSWEERKQIILDTVNTAKQKGDQNVYFIGMVDYLTEKGIINECSVDLCHPNDLGFYFMAEALEDVLKKALEKS